MDFIITVLANIAAFMFIASFFDVLSSKETWCGDDYEMSDEEQEAIESVLRLPLPGAAEAAAEAQAARCRTAACRRARPAAATWRAWAWPRPQRTA